MGPKFYIARPKLVGKKPRRYEGMTFTPLHCDLADAVNFSCSGEEATWHMFHRNDRASKQAIFLAFCLDHVEILKFASESGTSGNQIARNVDAAQILLRNSILLHRSGKKTGIEGITRKPGRL